MMVNIIDRLPCFTISVGASLPETENAQWIRVSGAFVFAAPWAADLCPLPPLSHHQLHPPWSCRCSMAKTSQSCSSSLPLTAVPNVPPKHTLLPGFFVNSFICVGLVLICYCWPWQHFLDKALAYTEAILKKWGLLFSFWRSHFFMLPGLPYQD